MKPGHDTLFRQILDEHGAALSRLAKSYEQEPARAEDLLQDICLAVWKALPRWRQDASLRTFVFRIAHNRGLTHGWREGKRGTVPLENTGDTLDPAPSAEERVGQNQRREWLLAAVRELPLGLRQVVTLKLEGLSSVEISEVLDLPAGTVRVRLHRAQKKLAERVPALFDSNPRNPTSSGDH